MATTKGGIVHECYYWCNSKKHTSSLAAALMNSNLSDEKAAAYVKWCCVKYSQGLDSSGRSLVHIAASIGRLKLLKFLLNHRNVNINEKDEESGYTALHRSLFYGQLHCGIRLIQLGASITQSDFEDLTPLDHVMKDRPSILTYDVHQPCEVYVWGTNTCYNLGIGHNNSRANPEPLGYFRKENISIKQAYMSKFHSLFIGTDGKVWVCGLGSGGRLGLGDEVTTLVPKTLKIGNTSSYSCKIASVGNNHTLLLLENGSVWSFGLNNYHQLGHSPPPDEVLSPRPIKALKGLNIIGMHAAKFHSVFWTKNQLFTCGLHAGQLGHLKTNDRTFPMPKPVTAIQLKTSTIEHVASSDGAMVVVSSKGDIYLFRDYQCKRITFFKLSVKKICILGGHLDHKVLSSSLQEKGGDELKIIILTANNTIHLWHEGYQQITLCLLSVRRYIKITDMVLNRTSLLLTTTDGEAFMGEIKIKKRKNLPEANEKQTPSKFSPRFLDKDDSDYIKLKRIPHIHRAVSVSSDLKGRNFAVVQVHPKTGLLRVPVVESTEMKQNMKLFLDTTSEFDTSHDVLFEAGGMRFPAHRYIVSYSSEVLRKMIDNAETIENKPLVVVENIQPQIFERILTYIYTGECDLLKVGQCPISWSSVNEGQEFPTSPVDEIINPEEISAFQNYKQQQQHQRSNKRKSGSRFKTKSNDPIECFKAASQALGLTHLTKILESFYYDGGYILCTNKNKVVHLPPPKFDRKELQNLWDISLKAEDGTVIKAHKCILVARLEYFNCMINQGWLESSLKTPLNMPLPSSVLEILIRYLYTDDIPELIDSHDTDLTSHVLVIADEFFCTRLKEIAEVSLANLLSLKLAAEMLQLSVTYNAKQLKESAKEFICLNLPALLESRSLEILDDSLLTELRDFYRSWLPQMTRRNMKMNSKDPDEDLVNKIYESEPVSLDKIEEEPIDVKPTPKTPKEKPQRKKRNSDSTRMRNFSVGSTTSDEELFSPSSYILSDSYGSSNRSSEESWIKITNHNSKLPSRTQSKVAKGVSDLSISKTPPAPEKISPLPVQRSTPIKIARPILPSVSRNFDLSDAESDFVVLKTSSDIEFPALGASTPEKTNVIVSPKSSNEMSKKFVKLSQRQRKKLATQGTNENEAPIEKFTPEETKPVWGITKVEISSMADIMKNETRMAKLNCVASSPPWQAPSSPTCSLSAIMAAERHQRDVVARMKSKPLEYTQMEDKAIDDLMLLYDISNVTDERITIRRADSVTFSPPVWVSSHR